MITMEMYRCRECGHEFVKGTGGFVWRMEAVVCPKCGSSNVKLS